MNERMKELFTSQRNKEHATRLVAVLCLALVITFSAIQVLHVHADGSTTENNCAICHVAKHTVSVAKATIVQSLLIASIVVVTQSVVLVSRTELAHSIRPPPVSFSLL